MAVVSSPRVADATELQVNAAAFTDSRDRGTPFTDNRSQGADASIRLVGRGRWGFSALAYLQTRVFESSFASINAAVLKGAALGSQQYKAELQQETKRQILPAKRGRPFKAKQV